MYHNGGFPPIFEGGQKEIIQREFSAKNILSISQILNNNNKMGNITFKREQPIVFNVLDKKPEFKKKK